MFNTLPKSPSDFMHWSWADLEPFVADLQRRPLNAISLTAWLGDWSDLRRLVDEMYQRLYVATTVNTEDAESERRYNAYLDEIYPRIMDSDQKLKEKLLSSRLTIPGFEVPLRNMRTEAAIYREANLPLLSEELKLSNESDKIYGAQTVTWEGKELTVPQLQPIYQDPDRSVRERAWRLAAGRQLADREALNELWVKLLTCRRQIAANADFPDYRAYRWQAMLRFDYTPQDCETFHRAIETVVVPFAKKLYEQRRTRLGVDSLRPWDLSVDPFNRPRLRPYTTIAELRDKTATIFQRVDPQLGSYFQTMIEADLLDLENRKGKAPGGYCTNFNLSRLPFIFMNGVGLHEDVQTLLHEGGHAFHVFESAHLPYIQQLDVGLEFAEVASMAMELLAAPYLVASDGGFYTPQQAARARIEHLTETVLFWPYMAVVDGFQHWVYQHPDQAMNPANCDACWRELWQRFMHGVDWSGLEEVLVTGWQRKLHIFQVPFYYVEYGLAALGSLQVWANALQDQANAVAAYRKALSLGGTVPLPELYRAAGAKLAFDAGTLGTAVNLVEQQLDALEAVT